VKKRNGCLQKKMLVVVSWPEYGDTVAVLQSPLKQPDEEINNIGSDVQYQT
jgi:hypothetical protein